MKPQSLLATLLFLPLIVQAQLQEVTYKDGAQALKGVGIAPQKRLKNAPGILILPAWKGIDNHTKEVAQELSQLGYFAFAADIYGVGNYPKDNAEAGQKAGHFKKDILSYQKRISLALDQLVKLGAHKDQIVIIGYCFGGTGALEAARAHFPVKGVVSFHGGLGKDAARRNDNINTKVLVCHGADDPYVSEDEIKAFQREMRESGADWQMIYYSDAVHAFTEKEAGSDKSKGAAYNDKANKRSWQHFMDFLKETFPQ